MKIFNIKYPKFYRPAKLPPRLNIDFTGMFLLLAAKTISGQFFVFTSELSLGVVWNSNYQGIKNKAKLTSDKEALVVVVVVSPNTNNENLSASILGQILLGIRIAV